MAILDNFVEYMFG